MFSLKKTEVKLIDKFYFIKKKKKSLILATTKIKMYAKNNHLYDFFS